MPGHWGVLHSLSTLLITAFTSAGVVADVADMVTFGFEQRGVGLSDGESRRRS